MDFCIYDDILDMLQVTDKKLLHFKFSKSGQILLVDKTCFPRPGNKWILVLYHFINIQYDVFFNSLSLKSFWKFQ